MKSKIILNTVKLCVITLLALLNSTNAEGLQDNPLSKFYPVDSNRIPEILTMISNRMQTNYNKIKTWQGEVEVITDKIYEGHRAEKVFKTKTNALGEIPKMVGDHREQAIEFALDVDKGFLFANYSPTKPLTYLDLNTGRDLGAKGIAGRRRAIVTPEYQIDCTGDTMRNGIITSRKAVKQTRQEDSTCANNMHPVYDPRKSFVPGRPVWETFALMLQQIDERGQCGIDGYTLKVEEHIDANTTQYRILLPGKVSSTDYLFMTMIFFSEKGFNITSLETTKINGDLFHKKTWDYEIVDGIYLPTKTTEQNFRPDTGRLSYDKIITFKNLQVNQPIPVETFTYNNLGLKNGDKFMDKIQDKEYIYQEGELIPANSGSSHMLKQTNPIKNLNKHCKHCRHKWKRLITLASRWLES